MKKYNLGTLTVKDPELCDTKEEIIIEILDRLQKYVAEADEVVKKPTLTLEERYNGVRHIGSAYSGLANFLIGVLKVEIREPEGMLVTQTLFNRIYYHETMLRVEMKREGLID